MTKSTQLAYTCDARDAEIDNQQKLQNLNILQNLWDHLRDSNTELEELWKETRQMHIMHRFLKSICKADINAAFLQICDFLKNDLKNAKDNAPLYVNLYTAACLDEFSIGKSELYRSIIRKRISIDECNELINNTTDPKLKNTYLLRRDKLEDSLIKDQKFYIKISTPKN